MTTIRQAEFPGDAALVRGLFDAYVAFLVDRVAPEVAGPVLAKYPPEGRAEAVDGFARLHAPPRGALLIAEAEGTPLGCGMMRMLEPGIAELQRIYVAPEARGRGLGRRLTETLVARAAEAGAARVRLDTGRGLTEALALYRDLGFREVPPYHDDYPDLQPHLVFYERVL